MMTMFNVWLKENGTSKGILASGVRYSDKSTVTQVNRADFRTEAMESAWQSVAEVFQLLKYQKIPALRLRWVFENAVLYSLTRNDGHCLCIFTTKNPKDLPAEELDRLFAEFQRLWA